MDYDRVKDLSGVVTPRHAEGSDQGHGPEEFVDSRSVSYAPGLLHSAGVGLGISRHPGSPQNSFGVNGAGGNSTILYDERNDPCMIVDCAHSMLSIYT